GALELLHVYLGDRLGLYRRLADDGPLTAAALASASGISPRYAREWLEEQAVAGILSVDLGSDDEGRRFSLPPGHAEVLTDVDRRLHAEPPARVADVGCGTGWSSIGIAEAYPKVTVEGLDLDSASIKEARHSAGQRGVGDRVKFEVRDAGDPGLAGSYDLVTSFETIHDMAHPVAALRAMRGLVKKGGVVLVVDEKVAEEFTAPGDDLERLMY